MSLSDEIYPLYDRVISVTFYRYDATNKLPHRIIEIPFLSDMGYKPNIEVSLEMLPSAVCFNMKVVLTNAAIVKNLDIQTFQWMQVRMGYTNNSHYSEEFLTEVYTGPVFSSYIEKPAPDSRIVFEGVATGQTGIDLFAQQPYKIVFHDSQHTIKEVATRIAQAIGINANFEKCDPKLYNRKLWFTEYTATADNRYALINWLQTTLYNHFKQLNTAVKSPRTGVLVEGIKPEVYCFLREDVLYVISSTSSELTRQEKTPAVLLNTIKTASFTAAVLNVEALYNPRLHPGDVFYMPPKYYTGGVSLLNSMDKSIFNPDDGYYRALTIEVSFATTGSTNSMKVMALPVSLYDGETPPEEIEREVSNWAQQQRESMIDDLTKSVTRYGPADEDGFYDVIVFGNKQQPAKEDVPPKDMWSTAWNGWTSSAIVKPPAGYTLSQLAQAQWGSDKFYLPDAKLSESFNRYMPDGVPLYYFFPLIQVATYKKMQQDKKTYRIDINNPDMLWENYSVAVPPLDLDTAKSFVGNSQVAGIFKSAIEFYNNKGEESWAKALTDIYNYLTKGTR